MITKPDRPETGLGEAELEFQGFRHEMDWKFDRLLYMLISGPVGLVLKSGLGLLHGKERTVLR